MKKILDKLDNDIDFLFRRGKRANERCYDFFIRTITFLILALIVLCYGSFAHASENYGTFFGGVQYDYFLKFEDVYNHYLEYDRQDSIFAMPSSGIGFIMSNPHSLGPFKTEDSYNNIVNFVDTKYQITGNENYKYSYTVLKRRANGEFSGNVEFSIYKFYSNSECFIVCNNTNTSATAPTYTVSNMDNSDMFIRSFSLNYASNSDYHVNFNSENTSSSFTLSPNGKGEIYFCDMPLYHMLYSNDGSSGNLTYKTMDSMIAGIRSKDVTIQLNPYLEVLNPQEPESPETESNANHMYFQNVKMGLTAQGENNNLSSSSLVVGCEVDDYIKNHMPEYKVYISCEVHYKDSVYTKNVTYGELLPLSLFYNQAYVKGLSELFSNMPWESPYANFYSYYRHLGDDYNVFTKNVSGKNGTLNIPTLIDILKFTSGFYQLDTSTSHVPNDFNINTFQLDVSVVITDSDTFDTKSGVFTQRFDFLNGNTSILKADALVNENPWEGVSEPTADPFPNGSAGGSSNGSVVQNNNQTVNVNIDNGFSVVNGGADGEDYDNTIDNIRNLLGEFKNGIGVISEASVNSETGQPNGFLGLLESTYSFIPGMNYFVIAIAIICALAVILFIIKVLLF